MVEAVEEHDDEQEDSDTPMQEFEIIEQTNKAKEEPKKETKEVPKKFVPTPIQNEIDDVDTNQFEK